MRDQDVKNNGVDQDGNIRKSRYEAIGLSVSEKKQKDKVSEFPEQAENTWQSIFDSISDWVVLSDLKGRIIRTNKAGEKFTGLSCEEIIGQSCCKLVHNSKKHLTACPMNEMFRTGQRNISEIQLPDGKWIAVTVEPIQNNENKITSLIHIIRDITLQKKTEETLRISEQKYKNIFIQANDAITYLDSFGRIIDVNDKAIEVFGGSREELINRHFTKLKVLSIKDIPKYVGLFKGVLSGNKVTTTIKIKNRKGETRFLDCSASLIKSSESSARIMVIARDITARKQAEQTLKESEQRYRSFVQNLSGIAYRGKMDFTSIFVHGSVEKITGYTEDELVAGKPKWSQVIYPDDLPIVFAEDKKKLCTVPNFSCEREYRIVRKDGQIRWIHEVVQNGSNEAGEITFVEGIIYDITERKLAEEALRISEERFKGIFENSLVGIYRTTPDGRIVVANKAIVKMLGYESFEELSKVNLQEHGFAESRPRSEFIKRIETDGQVAGFESDWCKKDGSYVNVRESTRAVRDKDGNTLYYEGTVENITDRKLAEHELRREHNLLRLLIDNIPDRIFLKDKEHRFTLVNNAMVQQKGFKSEDEVIGKTDFELYPQNDAKVFYSEEKEIIKSGNSIINKMCYYKNDDEWSLLTKVPLRDLNGDIVGLAGIKRDITQQKKAENALQESERKYRNLFAEMGHGFAIHEMVFDKEDKPSDYKTIEMNQAFERILDVKKENILNKNVSRFLPKEEFNKWLGIFEKVVLTKIPVHYERYSSKNKKYFKGYAYPIGEKQFAVIFEDITLRKSHEEALRRSEEKFRNVVENATEGILVIQNSKRVYNNSRWLEMVGFPEDEYKNIPFLSKIHPDDADFVTNTYEKLRNRKETESSIEFRVISKTNEIIFLSGKASCIQWENRPAVLVILEDITYRKQAENALQESEQKYRLLFENMINGFALYEIILDDNNKPVDYKFIEVNSAFEKLTALKRNDILNKNVTEVMPGIEKDPADWINKYGQVALTGKELRFEEYSETLDKWYSILAFCPRKGRFATIFEDITERRQAEQALRKSEAQLSNAMNIAHIGYWEYDLIDNTFIFNDQFYSVYHTSAEQVGGYKISLEQYAQIFLYPEDAQYLYKNMQELRSGIDVLENIRGIHRIKFGDGQTGYISVTFLIDKKDKKSRVTKIYGANQDITEQQQAQIKLRENETRYRELFENMTSGVAVYEVIDGGRDFIFKDFNRAGEKIDNQSREELIGKSIFEVRPGVKEFGLIDAFRKALKSGQSVHHPITFYEDNKITGWYDNYIYSLPSGELVTVFDDVTEKKQALEALQVNEERLRLLTNTIEDVFWMSTPGVREMIYISPSYEKIWDRTCESLYDNPKSFLDVMHPEDIDDYLNVIDKHHQRGKQYSCEYRIIPSEGKLKWILERGFPVHDSSGKLSYMTGVCTDITSKKQVQNALEENERLLNEVGKIAKIGGWEMDLITRKAKWTKGTYDIVEIDYDDPIPGPDEHLDYYLPEYRPVVEKAINDLVEKDIPLDFEAKARTAKGNIKWFRAIGKAIRKDDVCIKIFGTLQNVTENKYAEDVLNSHRRLLEKQMYLSKTLLDAMPCVAMLIKPETREIVASNKAAVEVGAIPGKTCYETWVNRTEPCPWCMAPELWITGKEQHLEVEYMDIAWDAYWIPVSENLYMHFAFDITKRKKFEKSILKYQKQLKSLASQLTLIEEKERYRIATELHDHIGQYLAVSKMKLGEIRDSIDSKETKQTLERVCEWLNHIIKGTRSLTFDLSSPILYELGFERAVAAYLEDEIQKKYNIETSFHSDNLPKSLEDEVNILLFRNVRELLFNIVKHAKARKVNVSISISNDNIKVEVQDDGIGFDSNSVLKTAAVKSKFGLFSIRERLEHFGGYMLIDSAPGKGTAITLFAPLKKHMNGGIK